MSRAAGEVWRAALRSGGLPCQLHVFPSIGLCQMGQLGAGNWLGESRVLGDYLETLRLYCQVKHLIKQLGFEERWPGDGRVPPPRLCCSVPSAGLRSEVLPASPVEILLASLLVVAHRNPV